MRWCVEAVLRLGDRSIWHSCESHRSMHGTHPGPQLEMGGAWKINDHLGLSEKSIPTLIALPSFSYKMYRWHVQTLIFWPVSSAGTYSTHLGTPTKPVLMKWPTVLRLPNSDIDRAERTNIQLFTGPSWQMCLKNGLWILLLLVRLWKDRMPPLTNEQKSERKSHQTPSPDSPQLHKEQASVAGRCRCFTKAIAIIPSCAVFRSGIHVFLLADAGEVRRQKILYRS